jgi:eukaryotic-like serine/threonine-protein kinase
MTQPEHDEQLLFALFALRLGVVSPNQIFSVVGDWMHNPDRDVAGALLESKLINGQQLNAIRNMVTEFVEAHRQGREPSAEFSETPDGPTLRVTLDAEAGEVPRTLGDDDELKLLDDIPLEFPGHYEMRQVLGMGGQARVLLAYDQHIGREIALKELRAHPDPSKQDTQKKSTQQTVAVAMRFLREAKITGKLEHPNIVPVYELGQRADGKLYYTMRRVRGKTLAIALAGQDSLSGRMTLLGHFLDLCNAIAYAHSHGVVHRDIKPANVMVGEFGETVVLDWGIAKVRGRDDPRGRDLERELKLLQTASINKTIPGVALGTPAYMSPEQASGRIEEIGERSDIWSLGVMLYELLVGKPAFLGESPRDVIRKVKAGSYRPVVEECPDAPAELAAVVQKALQVDREKRYQSAKELAGDVRAYMTGERVLAYEYSSWDLFKRFARKNKRIIAVAALFLIMVLASLVVVSVSYRNERAARENEVQARKREEAARNQERNERLKASYHLAQAYVRQAERLLEKRMLLSGRIYAAAALLNNPANPKSPYYQADVAPQLPGSEVLTVDAASLIYRTGHRLITGLVQTFEFEEAVFQAVFSPNGKVLATADLAGYLTVWDVQDGRKVYQVKGHKDRMQAVAFSPDGKRLATSGREGIVKIFRYGKDKPMCQTRNAGDAIVALAWSPDGTKLVSGDRKRQVLLWDASTCRLDAKLTVHKDLVHGVAFSPDGRWVASASWDKTVRVMDARTGKVRLELVGHTDAVHDVTFSPDGKSLATSGYDKTVRIWDLEKGALQVILKGHLDAVDSAVFSPDGKRIATAGQDASVMLWDVESARLLDALQAHKDSINSVAFSPDGGLLATAGLDRTAKLWWVAEKGPLVRLEHDDWAYGIDFTSDGSRMVTGGWDKTIRIWSAPEGKLIKILRGHEYGVWAVELSPDGRRLASGTFDGAIRFWDLATGKSIPSRTKHTGGLYDLAYSPVDELVATGGRDKNARLWNPHTGELVRVLSGHEDWVYGVAFSPDGRRLATASGDKRVRIWNVDSGETIQILEGHTDWVSGVAFSSDGKRLASGGKDRTIILWDLESGKEIRRYQGHTQWINSVRFSPDDKWLASAGDDRLVVVWETDTGRPLLRLRTVQSATRAVFSPDGQKLAVTDLSAILVYPLKDFLTRVDPATLLSESERVSGLKLNGFDLEVVSGK